MNTITPGNSFTPIFASPSWEDDVDEVNANVAAPLQKTTSRRKKKTTHAATTKRALLKINTKDLNSTRVVAGMSSHNKPKKKSHVVVANNNKNKQRRGGGGGAGWISNETRVRGGRVSLLQRNDKKDPLHHQQHQQDHDWQSFILRKGHVHLGKMIRFPTDYVEDDEDAMSEISGCSSTMDDYDDYEMPTTVPPPTRVYHPINVFGMTFLLTQRLDSD